MFLMLEPAQPLRGLIQIARPPMRTALSQPGKKLRATRENP